MLRHTAHIPSFTSGGSLTVGSASWTARIAAGDGSGMPLIVYPVTAISILLPFRRSLTQFKSRLDPGSNVQFVTLTHTFSDRTVIQDRTWKSKSPECTYGMNVPITCHPDFVDNPDEAFASLRDGLFWERRPDAPRCEYYCNDFPGAYAYGRGAGRRTYEPRPWSSTIMGIRMKLEALVGSKFEVCFLNRYLNQSDHLGWHADDSPEMDDARPIATVSLGVEREIWFRRTPIPGIRGYTDDVFARPWPGSLISSIHKVKLGHGSACLMLPGMQDEWQHRIPKASFQCGERISLTFRGYINPAVTL